MSIVAIQTAGFSPYLMRSANKIQVMFVKEFCYDVSPKSERDAPVVFSPTEHILVWIGPQEVTQETLVWYVCGTQYPSDLFHRLQVRGEACGKNKKIADGQQCKKIHTHSRYKLQLVVHTRSWGKANVTI